ncbi:MAG: high-potential iron-sulfur protein [Burkholderiaceae bacterium]|nr:high-potential iron-sulfur protein [Burkholderiaceae bacterium]
MNPSRRRFVVSAGGAISAAALASVLARTAQAADLPHLSPTDPTATAFAYVESTAKIKNPKFVAGSDCKNCNFYQARNSNAAYGPCLIFQGKSVNAKGWCTNYVKAA